MSKISAFLMKLMITYFPDYYKDFKCIADKCRHTCCAGWEIDIDDASLERFKAVPSVAEHIKDGSIVLGENERCPFLRDDGLCSMILTHGEDFLCDICREHPRFYNESEDYIEGGIGLVCEEACRIILDKQEDFTLVPFKELPACIGIVFDPARSLTDRLSLLKETVMPSLSRALFINTLEVMDSAWTKAVDKILQDPPALNDEERIINQDPRRFSNFCAYLLYRYPDETGFAVEATYLLADLVITGLNIYDSARMFSGEIEYSDINICEAIGRFSELPIQ